MGNVCVEGEDGDWLDVFASVYAACDIEEFIV